MGVNPNADPNVVRYFTERIQTKGFTDVKYELTDEGSSAIAKRGDNFFRVSTDRTDALKQLWILVKDLKPFDDW